VRRFAAFLDTEGGVRFLWWLIGGMLVVAFFVFLAVGANGPDDPSLSVREGVADFGSIAFGVEHGAITDDFCALLAATDAQRQTGMMGRKDLSGFDAMVFAYPRELEPSQLAFDTRKVPIPLSVAWFNEGGAFVSTTDMELCPDTFSSCPTFRAAGRWKFALEVPKGGLGRLGIGPGSVLKLGASGC
jgi:uncharacterized membrane protein (UPF0127 family)